MNQAGRRNLSAYQRSVLALGLKDDLSELAKLNLSLAGQSFNKNQPLVNLPKVDEPINSREDAAKQAGISGRNLEPMTHTACAAPIRISSAQLKRR